MKSNFSPSINILRDKGKQLHYIPTANAKRIIDELNKNISVGFRSFNLIGSFGTGKSAFLLALERDLTGKRNIFTPPLRLNGTTKYHFVNIVGDYRSFSACFSEGIGSRSTGNLIENLDKLYQKTTAEKKGLIIFIDEFGKFLEFAAENYPEKELYNIQKIAEYVNEQKRNILLISTLHQGFDSYALRIKHQTKNEWEKVKGRFKEILFNEPIEQLLTLAAEFLENIPQSVANKQFNELFKAIKNSKAYPLFNHLSPEIAGKLYPLDLLAAGFLTNAIQRYGQNDRSLFTFLETHDLKNHEGFFNIADVHDYLINNFYSLLSSKYNPDYMKWAIIKASLERTEILFEKQAEQKCRIIKAIGIMNIFAPKGAVINRDFLNVYGRYALGILDIQKEIEILLSKKIIRYQNFSDTYVLFEGTDLDIDLALQEAEKYVQPNFNIIARLKEYFNFPYIPVKASFLKNGTPRFFEFLISETPINKLPLGEVDGYVNIIFSDNLRFTALCEFSKSHSEAILYGMYVDPKRIREIMYELDKVEYVLESVSDDRVAYRELINLKLHLTSELNYVLVESLFEADSKIKWVFRGESRQIYSRHEFNKVLSNIIENIYPLTPIFLNELINRERLPAAISTARKTLLQHLIDNWDKKDLGFNDRYPPEKSIYLSLLKNTGIHYEADIGFTLGAPNKDLLPIWNICEQFLESCKTQRKTIEEVYNILYRKPFKLKKGFIDFWIPIFLFIKRDEYALFNKDMYILNMDNDLIDLLIRNPQEYFIKSYDIQGIKLDLFNKYRELINKTRQEKVTKDSFNDTIRPFLSFYRNLPDYVKQTNKLSKQAKELRNAIATAKDPEQTFFEDFPSVLGYSSLDLNDSEKVLKKFILELQDCIKEIRSCQGNLILRIENHLLKSLNFENSEFNVYKDQIKNRYASLKEHLLLPYQKAFYSRVTSQLDDKEAWINSLVHCLVGKNMNQITDDEEKIIYDKLEEILSELDKQSDLAKLNLRTKDEAIQIEINSIGEQSKKEVIRIKGEQREDIDKLHKDIKKLLKGDKEVIKIVLLNLLKEELK